MYIIDQSSDHCSIYDIHDAQIRKSFRYDGLATVLREFSTHARVAQEKSIVCLLSEELFSLHRFVIHMSCDEPFSIQQLKACIQQKCGEIADAEEIRTPYVVHHVMDIVVNGVAGQHVL